MQFINNLLNKLFGPSDEEMDKYYHRFIAPHRERLRAAGATEVEIDKLWQIVLKKADPTVVGQAPGALLAAMADRAEAGEPIARIIDTTDLEPPTEEEADEILRAAGYDPDEVGRQIADFAKRASEASDLR